MLRIFDTSRATDAFLQQTGVGRLEADRMSTGRVDRQDAYPRRQARCLSHVDRQDAYPTPTGKMPIHADRQDAH